MNIKPIPGFDGYAVDSDGRVWSCHRPAHMRHLPASWRPLKPHVAPHGYAQVTLFRDGRRHLRHVHSLVLLAWVGPPSEGQQACHNNGVRSDNRLANLRWDSVAANHADKRAHGTMPLGEGHGHAKLSESQVAEIRRLRSLGVSGKAIGRRFGVSDTWVYRIANRKNWTHV